MDGRTTSDRVRVETECPSATSECVRATRKCLTGAPVGGGDTRHWARAPPEGLGRTRNRPGDTREWLVAVRDWLPVVARVTNGYFVDGNISERAQLVTRRSFRHYGRLAEATGWADFLEKRGVAVAEIGHLVVIDTGQGAGRRPKEC